MRVKKRCLLFLSITRTCTLSLRNIPNLESSQLADVNTYDIVNAEVLVLIRICCKNVYKEEEEEVTA